MPAPLPLASRTVVITGASSGIGLETARGVARLGASVILVGRDKARGEAAMADVRGTAPGARLDLVLGDLAVQKEVRRVAAELREKCPRIDVLVNNAGILLWRRRETPDGIEATLAVNHLAPFLLTNLLLDRLQASAPCRIVNVASDAHHYGRIDLDDLGRARGVFNGWGTYAQSKLANVLFTAELAKRLAGTGVTANSLHPGTVSTQLFRSTPALLRWPIRAVFVSPEKGARTSIHLASSPEVEGATGKYFRDAKPVWPSRAAQDMRMAARLWEASARMTGLVA